MRTLSRSLKDSFCVVKDIVSQELKNLSDGRFLFLIEIKLTNVIKLN